MTNPEGAVARPRRARRRAAAAALLAATLNASCAGGSSGVRDPANELPFGRVDVPVAGARVTSQTPIAGWALDDRGIREIRVYVDGHINNSGGLSDQRPDVSRAYPRYAAGTHLHGWTLLMGFDAPGSHAVVVQAVDSDGATRDIGVFEVTALDK